MARANCDVVLLNTHAGGDSFCSDASELGSPLAAKVPSAAALDIAGDIKCIMMRISNDFVCRLRSAAPHWPSLKMSGLALLLLAGEDWKHAIALWIRVEVIAIARGEEELGIVLGRRAIEAMGPVGADLGLEMPVPGQGIID